MKSADLIKMAAALVIIVALGVAFVQLNKVSLPEGPVSIVWDREVCAHCKMHIGDPRFAGQIQTLDGQVLNFDDPGCLFDYLEDYEEDIHAVYFHDHASDEWLSRQDVAFLPTEESPSPMGYGIRAVRKGTPESNDWDWARARVLGSGHHQGGP